MNIVVTPNTRVVVAALACCVPILGLACHQEACDDYLVELQRLDMMIRSNTAEWDKLATVVQSARRKGVTVIDILDQSFMIEDLPNDIRELRVSWHSFSKHSDSTWQSTDCGIVFSQQEWAELQNSTGLLKVSGAMWLIFTQPSGIGGSTPRFEVRFVVPGRGVGETSLRVVWAADGMAVNAGTRTTGYTSQQWCHPQHNNDTRWSNIVDNWYLVLRWS